MDEIGRECSTNGEQSSVYRNLVEGRKEIDHQEDLDVVGRIILGQILE
jgi:hypothetical protein